MTARRVLIAGAGVAALEAALVLQHDAAGLVETELLAPEADFSYRPLSIADAFGVGELVRFDLDELVQAAGARRLRGELARVDAGRRIVLTRAGESLAYDHLIIACGAVPEVALPGAFTYRGESDADTVSSVLDEIAAGRVRSVAFVVPTGLGWPLPLYELLLLTASALAEGTEVMLSLVTPEEAPLALFGTRASEAVAGLLATHGVVVHSGAPAIEATRDGVRLVGGSFIAADLIVTLPRLRGPFIPGLPADRDGFLPVDALCRVVGLDGVLAAGDVTSFPIKQGGTAAQQAFAAATVVASEAGAQVEPRAFEPVLRGLLLTGTAPLFMRAGVHGGGGDSSGAETTPLWWPPSKIAGRYLGPFLAARAGARLPEPAPREGDVQVEAALDSHPT